MLLTKKIWWTLRIGNQAVIYLRLICAITVGKDNIHGRESGENGSLLLKEQRNEQKKHVS